jgi:putative membrane protein
MNPHHMSHSGPPIAVPLVLIAVALIYLRGWYRLRATRPHEIGARQLAEFIGGLFVLWVATGSPLAAMDHQYLTAHMLQHLLIMTVAAPLILLAAPAIALRPSPLFCWLAATATVIGWHVPAVFELGMQSVWSHGIEHAWFLAAGLLFWWPVVGQSLGEPPRWSVPVYLFLATLPCDALSAFLTFCNRVVYPHYLLAPHRFSPLGDQECAGALMWVWVTFAYLAPAVVLTIQMLSPQPRVTEVSH